MKEILIKGRCIVIDDDVYVWAIKKKWHFIKTSSGKEYPTTNIKVERCIHCGQLKNKSIRIHTLVCGQVKGFCIDHINGNTLDNRRENLRFVTKGQNNLNRCLNKNSTTGYKGVSFKKSNRFRPYISRLKVNGKSYFGGCFATPEEAAISYDNLAIKYHGIYAKTNFLKSK